MIVGTYYNEKKKELSWNYQHGFNNTSSLDKESTTYKKKDKTLWTNKLFNIDITSN